MQEPRLIRSAVAYVLVFCILLIGPLATSAGDNPAEINVAYFQQWPAPIHFAQAKMTFDSVPGMTRTDAANQQWSLPHEPMPGLIARTAEMDAWIGDPVSVYSGEIAG